MEYFYSNLRTNTVFTLRKNRSFIPDFLTETANRDKLSSRFLFTDPKDNLPPVSLQSFITNSKKLLLLGSTIHSTGKIIDDDKGLSELNNYYNHNKGGVDSYDQIISLFSCKRRTLRWSLSFFYTILDIACINSYLIASKLGLINNTKDSRREFMISLAIELSVDKVRKRKFYTNQHLFYANSYLKEANKRMKIDLPSFELSYTDLNSNRTSDTRSKYCGRLQNQNLQKLF